MGETRRRAWPGAVVFDLDGTLIDSAPDIRTALNEVLEAEGITAFSRDEVALMIGGGVRKLIERALARRGEERGDAEIDELTARFLTLYNERATRETTLFDGAEELLRHLTQNVHWVGLCTNKPGAVTRRILGDLGVLGYFDCIVGGDEGYAKKPDPEPLLATLGELAGEPQNAVLIGDSAADVGAARAAGMSVVLMSYGYSPVPQRELGADAVCERLDEVPAALESLAASRTE